MSAYGWGVALWFFGMVTGTFIAHGDHWIVLPNFIFGWFALMALSKH